MPLDPALQFPPGFRFGTATASYQIEGAVQADGRGESIWDRFSHTPGAVRNGDTGDIATDHYHRWREDIDLMRRLGVNAYRFSIAWPRIMPDGRGQVNNAGLDFYDRLVDGLLGAGIEPFITLYHWDLPQALEDAGGWPNRDTADAFAGYAETVTRRLGDRVRHWLTHNEPWVVAWGGYGSGSLAPGVASTRAALATVHHVLLSHGMAVPVIRRESPSAEVGIVLNLTPAYPASDTPADREAATHQDGRDNRWFLDPIFRASYPEDLAAFFGDAMPEIRPGDMETIATPIDILGVNNYSRTVVRADPDTGLPVSTKVDGAEYTNMGWEVYPRELEDLLLRVHRDYAPPVMYVTENGAAFTDVQGHDGRVLDPERIAYLQGYMSAVRRAIDGGAPVRGYFVWSLLDNFEWALGYSRRFGLIYVDYPTLRRIPKGSFDWYREVIAGQVAREQ